MTDAPRELTVEEIDELEVELSYSYPNKPVIAAVCALARRALSQSGGEWQPIKTAPKDGTFVLLITAKAWCPSIARWNGEGWGDEFQDFHIEGLNMPTHWMPLPLPPSPSVRVEREREGMDKK